MKAISPKDIHCLWLIARWRPTVTRADFQDCTKELLDGALPRDIERLLEMGSDLGLVTDSRDGWGLTGHGKGFARLNHWREWKPTKSARERLKSAGLEKLFLGTATAERPAVIDLFAGAGGLGLGFESAGFRVAVAVDNDPQACEAHRKNFPDCEVVEDSIERIAGDPIGTLCTPYGVNPEEVAGVIGGPPCQGFSFMGERVVDDERNLLTSRFADVVLAIEPSFFVMENVQGLLSIGAVPEFSEYVIRAGKSIGTYATSIVHRLPAVPRARAQRDRQFRKKLVSRAITSAKVRIADFAATYTRPDSLAMMLEESETAIREAISSAAEDAFDLDQRQMIVKALEQSADDITMIALGALVEALINATAISASEWEDQLKLGLPRLKGRRKQIVRNLLDSYDAAPASTTYQSVTVGPLLSRLIRRLSDKYRIAPPTVLSAAWYGAPQDRRRLFLVGIHKRHNRQFEFPLPDFDIPGKQDRGTLLDLPFAPTCSDAIGDLPDIDAFDCLVDSDKLPSRELAKPNSVFQKHARLETMELGDFTRCRPDWNPFITDCCLRTLHAEHVLDRLRETELGKQDETSHKTRLHPDRVSHTIRAGTREKMGSHTAVRPIHYCYHRVISVREGARLMGFPDWMTFHKTKWHGFRLVGNGVPLHLGRAIARQLWPLTEKADFGSTGLTLDRTDTSSPENHLTLA